MKHYDVPGHLHFLTFSTNQRLQLLTNDILRKILAQRINESLEEHSFQLSAFVFMPEHVHMLVWPQRETYSMGDFLHSVKHASSLRIENYFRSINSSLIQKLTVNERPGTTCFRFWQEGGGFDRNAWSEKYLRSTLDYIHKNPVKRRLVKSPDRWRWSSWHAYNTPERPPDPEFPRVNVLQI